MTPTPNRRWLRYSLETLFVAVTVLACWLGYELNWIHQRREALASGIVRFPIDGVHEELPPWQLRLLGERNSTPDDLLLPFDIPDPSASNRCFPSVRFDGTVNPPSK